MKLPRDQLVRAATKAIGPAIPRPARRYIRMRLAHMLKDGVCAYMTYGGEANIAFRLTRQPFRCDESPVVQPSDRKDETKGWWAARVRSSYGAVSTLLYSPASGMVEGYVRLR